MRCLRTRCAPAARMSRNAYSDSRGVHPQLQVQRPNTPKKVAKDDDASDEGGGEQPKRLMGFCAFCRAAWCALADSRC